ncbi:hypothetical protein HYQ45_010469 [Verticillium longisporum]|uniref:Uncharacterized protein n=1 Tax=Verticillium longisporum TaxID=100787 RepID=A0A8I2ZI99_VERLO|nr:hypothetical protein HYQ45_010469 [Verticillium longisporum]
MYRRPPGPPRHYSYECKEPAQARPYVPRPSRTQQLRDPKLLPKLTEATPNEAENKKGIADAELAKREAERERQRALEARDAAPGDDKPRRRDRSASIDSVSAISTEHSGIGLETLRLIAAVLRLLEATMDSMRHTAQEKVVFQG